MPAVRAAATTMQVNVNTPASATRKMAHTGKGSSDVSPSSSSSNREKHNKFNYGIANCKTVEE